MPLIVSVDYVVFATANVTLNVNPNEVSDILWVSKEELEDLFQDTCGWRLAYVFFPIVERLIVEQPCFSRRGSN